MIEARVTIAQIARRAGVSRATVDRVLHGRASVQPHTRAHVLAVAAALGRRAAPAPPRTGRAPTRLAVLVPDLRPGVFAAIEAAVAGRTDPSVVMRLVEVGGIAPQAVAAAVAAVDEPFLALAAVDHPVVRQALGAYRRRGGRAATFLSELSGVPLLGHVGVDNRAEGRIAACLARLLTPHGGRVALLHGSAAFRSQDMRAAGFRAALAEAPGPSMGPRLRTDGPPERVRDEVAAALERAPDVGLVYNLSIHNRAVAAAAARTGARVIAHDLTDATAALLRDGGITLLIDQDVPRLLDALAYAVREVDLGRAWPGHALEPRILSRENIPPRPPQNEAPTA